MVDMKKGAEVIGYNGRVHVLFETDTLSESMIVKVNQADFKTYEGGGLSHAYAFEITAYDLNGEKEIKQFKKQFPIRVQYDADAFTPEEEEQLQLYYYDEETGEWTALISEVDYKNHIFDRL